MAPANAVPTGRPMVWIEDEASHISRGQADSLTREGLHVNLPEPPAFHPGDQVAVRLAFERGAPSFATTARVTSIRSGAVLTECNLMWLVSPAERKSLEAWLLGSGFGRSA
jgi:hypothetical protein